MRNLTLLAALISIFFFPVAPVQAASQDECAIWVCLPTGFTTGCSGPKQAFKKRIRNAKSPLPNFASCLVSGGYEETGEASTIEKKRGNAAYIPPRKVCSQRQNEKEKEK